MSLLAPDDGNTFHYFLSGGDLAQREYAFCRYRYDYHNDQGRNDCKHYTLLVVMTVLMLIDAVVVFGVSIWAIATNSSAIRKARGCARCCMCCQESTPQAPVIIYLPANQVSAS